MFRNVSPEDVGVSSASVLKFLNMLEGYNMSPHSIIMAKGNKIFTECYYEPFDKDKLHRMYSVTKSFVGVAVGLAAEKGFLSLDDKFMKYFEEYRNENVNELYDQMTIRDALKMQTCRGKYDRVWFFNSGCKDRCEVFFRTKASRIPGTLFMYDSCLAFMLGVIVEKVTGMPFLQFLRVNILDHIGFSKEAYCLKCPGGHSFGDSGLLCTSRDLLYFAKFVMNKGVWRGKRYMNADYLIEATSKLTDNRDFDILLHDSNGYGYQIWGLPRGGFGFLGMGDQLVFCDPQTEFIFVMTADNQGISAQSRTLIYNAIVNGIVNEMVNHPIPQNPADLRALNHKISSLKLHSLKGNSQSPLTDKINKKRFILEENPMGIKWLSFDFQNNRGVLNYENAQGEKQLLFGMAHNEFSLFPEEGYSDLVAGEDAKGNRYECACSAEWSEKAKLRISVQIIDKYFGRLVMVFSFKDNRVQIEMIKVAENFLDEYQGVAIGTMEE